MSTPIIMIEMLNHLRALSVFRPINTLITNFTVYDWAVTADESSDNLRLFRPLLKKKKKKKKKTKKKNVG